MFAVQCNILDGISIHASEKEATIASTVTILIRCNFNPRLREGGDQDTASYSYKTVLFQSTPPRRRRLYDSRKV